MRIPGKSWTGEQGGRGARRELLDALALGHGVLHALVERGLLIAAAVADGQLRLQLRLQRRALRLQLHQPRLRQEYGFRFRFSVKMASCVSSSACSAERSASSSASRACARSTGLGFKCGVSTDLCMGALHAGSVCGWPAASPAPPAAPSVLPPAPPAAPAPGG